jgi:hypothetical protein
MSQVLKFPKSKLRRQKKSDERTRVGCEIIIFPGIRYSREEKPVNNDKPVTKRRRSSPKHTLAPTGTHRSSTR